MGPSRPGTKTQPGSTFLAGAPYVCTYPTGASALASFPGAETICCGVPPSQTWLYPPRVPSFGPLFFLLLSTGVGHEWLPEELSPRDGKRKKKGGSRPVLAWMPRLHRFPDLRRGVRLDRRCELVGERSPSLPHVWIRRRQGSSRADFKARHARHEPLLHSRIPTQVRRGRGGGGGEGLPAWRTASEPQKDILASRSRRRAQRFCHTCLGWKYGLGMQVVEMVTPLVPSKVSSALWILPKGMHLHGPPLGSVCPAVSPPTNNKSHVRYKAAPHQRYSEGVK